MNRRRGTSLIEMLALMTAASAVLTLGATLVHRTMHASSRARAAQAEESMAWRLAEQLRRDAAGAESASWSDDDRALAFVFPDAATVRYGFSPSLIERSEPLSEGRVARESWTLRAVGSWTVKLDSPALLSVEAAPPEHRGPTGAPLSFHVVTRIGLAPKGAAP